MSSYIIRECLPIQNLCEIQLNDKMKMDQLIYDHPNTNRTWNEFVLFTFLGKQQ